MISLREFINNENDYTIKLRKKGLPKEDRNMAFYLRFDGDLYEWVLLTFKRVPNRRRLSKDERKHLWSSRWRVMDKVRFKTFPEARLKLIESVNVLISKGYRVTSMSTVFDLPS